jgi:hypothetical protein
VSLIASFKRNVRELAFKLMKRVKVPGQNVAAICSATPEMVERFARTENKMHGPSVKDFKLDLTSKGLASAWNKRAAVIFADYFLQTKKYSCPDKELIREVFTTHMVQLKTQYKRFVDGQAGQELPTGARERYARLARRRSVSCNFLLDGYRQWFDFHSCANAGQTYALRSNKTRA